jgi:hypothetical protein
VIIFPSALEPLRNGIVERLVVIFALVEAMPFRTLNATAAANLKPGKRFNSRRAARQFLLT